MPADQSLLLSAIFLLPLSAALGTIFRGSCGRHHQGNDSVGMATTHQNVPAEQHALLCVLKLKKMSQLIKGILNVQ